MATSSINYTIAEKPESPSLQLRSAILGRTKVLTIFGTRPEVIKLSSVIRELEQQKDTFRTINVTSSQHADMVHSLVRLFDIRVDYDLRVMKSEQSVSGVCARVLTGLQQILDQEKPDLVVVQGDTASAFAGALAAFYHEIPVAHVEAGLRSKCDSSPFPEEMHRKLITRLTSYHFAATPQNREVLLAEGVSPSKVFVTGNPVIDALQKVVKLAARGERLKSILQATHGSRRIVLTSHRRESLGRVMLQNFKAIRDFVELHEDVTLIFSVHPNPSVVRAANQVLASHPRILMAAPFEYTDFIQLLSESWLIVSDSGGIQEEAPSLGKPLLIIRDNTERLEAVEAGFARLVGGSPTVLTAMLEDAYQKGSWVDWTFGVANPFGRGDASRRIVRILSDLVTRRESPQPCDSPNGYP
jgi:UDP-N-acetylglucosamine 2-epimerase (non-hydrolysing)